MLGCLNQAVPGGVAASGPGQSAVIAVTARDPVTRRKRVNVINPFCGGSGGRAGVDGVDGVDGPQASLKNTPTEIVEAETLIRVRQYQLAPDTFAAGQWRGGAAIVMDIENTDLDAVMAVRGLNRFQFASWGSFGGRPGVLGKVVLNPGCRDERKIERLNIIELKQGDIVRMTTPTGGGFGDPLLRDPALVAADVRSGLLTKDRAAADYGVVFDASCEVDTAATRSMREGMAAERPVLRSVCICGQRSQYQHVWPASVRQELARAVLREEVSIRAQLFQRVHRRFLEAAAPVSADCLAACLEAERRNIEGQGMIKTDAAA